MPASHKHYSYILGPHTGVPSLHGMFPEMPRSEIADLLLEYRKEYVIHNQVIVHVLSWRRTGSVWAMKITCNRSRKTVITRAFLNIKTEARSNLNINTR